MNRDSQSTTPDRPGEGGRAVVLLSGGLDSATALAIANAAGYETFALTVRYGQRHAGELAAARRVAEALGVTDHLEIGVDLGVIGGSALTADIPVPHAAGPGPHEDGTARDAVRRDEDEQEIPVTYVPARNTVFLSLALAWAEVLEAEHIFIGVNAVDYSGYPDCRPEFVEAFERLAGLATRAGVSGRPLHIHTPLIAWSKARIIARGMELGVDYALTTSCYAPAPDGAACGDCDACALRQAGFLEAGVPDPIRYTRGSAI